MIQKTINIRQLFIKPIPRGGGIPLFIGVLVASLFFLPMTKVIIATLNCRIFFAFDRSSR